MSEKRRASGAHMIMSTIWGGDFVCFHCGERLKMSALLPCSLVIVGAIGKAFAAEHRRCKPRQRGADLKEEHTRAYEALAAKTKSEDAPP